MKKYTPIKMIRAGRYKVCFDGLESEVQAGGHEHLIIKFNDSEQRDLFKD